MTEKRRYRPEDAETLAISALAWMAGRPEELGRFLALSGIAPEAIRAAAAEPAFLAGVLDHICSDESLLLAFAADGGLSPMAVAGARQALAGADG